MDAIEIQEAIRPSIWAVQVGQDGRKHLFQASGQDHASSKCGIVTRIKYLRDPQNLNRCTRCDPRH